MITAAEMMSRWQSKRQKSDVMWFVNVILFMVVCSALTLCFLLGG